MIETIKARVNAWDAAQGGNAILDGTETWLLFPNGAMRTTDLHGPLMDPPVDPLERCSCIERFWELSLQRETQRFRNRKSEILSQTPSTLATYKDKFERELKAMQRKVQEVKAQRDAAVVATQKASNGGHDGVRVYSDVTGEERWEDESAIGSAESAIAVRKTLKDIEV